MAKKKESKKKWKKHLLSTWKEMKKKDKNTPLSKAMEEAKKSYIKLEDRK